MNDFADLTIDWIHQKFPQVKIDRAQKAQDGEVIIVYNPPTNNISVYGDWIASIKLQDNHVWLWGAMQRNDKPTGCKIPLSDPELYPLIEAYFKMSTKYRVNFY